MFQQVPPSVCWTSFADANALVSVGTEAVALLCQNIVIFHDVRTREKSYYKGDNFSTCAGISLLTGHKRFPVFAVAERVLRPSIFVLKYPEMEKLSQLETKSSLTYVDMNITDHGTLFALSSGPNYILQLWNYHTGVHLAQVDTNKKCSKHCIFASPNPKPSVIQYSKWHQEIVSWELCSTADQYTFHEMTTIKIGDEYDKSNLFLVAFTDTPHIVNDYGLVSSISPGCFAFKPEWAAPNEDNKPRAYRIFCNKGGLLVVNDFSIYFIKKRNQGWILEWKIVDSSIIVIKMISNWNGESYVATHFGNIYYVEHTDEGPSLKALSNTNCAVKDYSTMKGIKEEAVLILTEDCELRLVEMSHMNTLSSLFIPNASCLKTHMTGTYAAVGTSTGKVYYISFEKLRDPVILAEQMINDQVEISEVRLNEYIGFIMDKWNGCYIVKCDYNKPNFEIALSFGGEGKKMRQFRKIFLLNIEVAMLFVSSEKLDIYAKDMWLLNWHLTDVFVQRREFQLKYLYKDFTVLQPYTMQKVEFVGIRKDAYIFDLMLLENYSSITILSSLHTFHFGHLNSISGTHNIITSATQGVIYHFYSHKKSNKPYIISRALLTTYVPRLRKRMDECFKSKYLLVLYAGGYLLAFRIPQMHDSLKENQRIENENEKPITRYIDIAENLRTQTIVKVRNVSTSDLEERNSILEELNLIRQSMTDLINYDVSVTGQQHGVYRKFCLNSAWLQKLTAGARILCHNERIQLNEAIEDQNRVKNWILNLIKSSENFFSIKLRSIFSYVLLENYAMYPVSKELLDTFDYFRFYDLDLNEDENENEEEEKKKEISKVNELEQLEEGEEQETKFLKRYVFEKDCSVYDHVMSKCFELQDIHTVTFNQMYNEEAKVKTLYINALKQEFNKEFAIATSFKQEVLADILETNNTLKKIHSNLNCMLCLLNMETIEPPELTFPEWMRDENLERIMTVDDSEITAVNRRSKASTKVPFKSGRMLLWPLEYWKRAIMNMMDGVLEKLWEEEIKKTPLEPEFMKKKSDVEYTQEEQKIAREYTNKLMVLENDRRKYMRMLKENETKVLNRKKQYIQNINERIKEIVILKLNYDFAIKHEQIRLLNTKLTNYGRIHSKININVKRARMDRIIEYISKYSKLVDYWERSLDDLKTKHEAQTSRDKQLDRQFKSHYLNSIPVQLTFEVNKLYRRRPKLPAKAFSTAGICYEIADRLTLRKKYKFPLPQELQEFLALLDTLDNIENCPNQLDQKLWENFIKLRRQKLESELRLKGIGYQIAEAQDGINFNTKELNTIKVTRADLSNAITQSLTEYFDITTNRSLEFILTVGQVEVKIRNVLAGNYKNFMIMNVRDIEEVNELIKNAGQKKIAAMQRIAFFRRQVIYKEWEHKVVRTNIEYLEYVCDLINNCKVTHEFLEILRNWKRFEENRDASSAVGSIEKKIHDRIDGYSRHMHEIDKKIEKVRSELFKIRSSSRLFDRQIEYMKTDLTEMNLHRDLLSEEKEARERNERFKKIQMHRVLIENVRRDYVQILELQTILELQRLRTYPTLGPAPQCAVIPQ